jgi:hypothetical protein
MAFPLTIKGTITIPKGHANAFSKKYTLDLLANIFENDRWTYYDIQADEISFRSRRVLVNAWSNPFGAASSGTIKIFMHDGQANIKYMLSLKYMLFQSIILSVFVMAPSLLYANNITNIDRIMIVVGTLLWIYGGSYMFTIYKFPRYLKNILNI